jgi:dTDP-L-rhamnose 4-epimerase
MRILVTGGAGFIGSHLVDALVARGHKVVALDSFDPRVHARRPEYLNREALWLVGDAGDRVVLREALRGVDAVSHQASAVGAGHGFADAEHYVQANDVATARLLLACREARVSRFVLASSMVIYGEGAYRCDRHGSRARVARSERDLARGVFDPRCDECGGALEPCPVSEEQPANPRSVYATTKLHQEHLAFACEREEGPAVTALRYHNVYGPRMPRNTPYAGVASLFRSQIARGGPPQVFEDGGQRRDFVHVSDVAGANVLALEREEPARGAFNISSGEPRTVLDLARALARALAAPEPVVTGEYRPGDVRHVVASPERARRELAYRARVGFAQGMAEFAHAPLRDAVA